MREESLCIDDITNTLERLVCILDNQLMALWIVSIVLENGLSEFRAKTTSLLGRIDEELGQFGSELTLLPPSMEYCCETSQVTILIIQQEVIPIRVHIDSRSCVDKEQENGLQEMLVSREVRLILVSLTFSDWNHVDVVFADLTNLLSELWQLLFNLQNLLVEFRGISPDPTIDILQLCLNIVDLRGCLLGSLLFVRNAD